MILFSIWNTLISSVAYILWAAWIGLIVTGIAFRIYHEVRERAS